MLRINCFALIIGAVSVAASAMEKPSTPPRYTRLDVEGQPVSQAAAARCVHDLRTDLVWELKTHDGSVHDVANRYRWGGDGAEKTGKRFYDDWNKLLNTANKENLCGLRNWRVPSVAELQTLVTEEQEPTINIDHFPRTLPLPYWSTSTYERHTEHAQTVHFGNGATHYYNGYRGEKLPVRLVHGDKTSP